MSTVDHAWTPVFGQYTVLSSDRVYYRIASNSHSGRVKSILSDWNTQEEFGAAVDLAYSWWLNWIHKNELQTPVTPVLSIPVWSPGRSIVTWHPVHTNINYNNIISMIICIQKLSLCLDRSRTPMELQTVLLTKWRVANSGACKTYYFVFTVWHRLAIEYNPCKNTIVWSCFAFQLCKL